MNKIAIAVSAALLALGAASTASAQSGTITFNGEVTATTCTVDFSGLGVVTGADPVVTLPDVATGSLLTGNSAGKTDITVTIGGTADPQCTTGQAALELNPNRDASVSPSGRLNGAPGGAANVVVGLRDSKDQLINLTTPWRSEVISLGVTKEIKFSGEYYAEGADAGAGTVTATVGYTMDYN